MTSFKNNRNIQSFTLLELLLVILILGILAALIAGNFINSLKKGRDARRKDDLFQIQRGLEIYYEDKRLYPSPAASMFGSQFTDPSTNKIYMQKIPNDPVPGKNYMYCTDSSSSPAKYQLYAILENANDPAIISPSYLSSSGGTCTPYCDSISCNYGISSSDTSP